MNLFLRKLELLALFFHATPPLRWDSDIFCSGRSPHWKRNGTSFCTYKTHFQVWQRAHASSCLSKETSSFFIYDSSQLSKCHCVTSPSFAVDGRKIITDMAHNSNRVNSGVFFYFFPFVAWETGNVMGRTWGLLWGRPLLARWKAHSSHFSYWIVLRLLFNVAFSPQPCTRQSVGMKLLSTILPSPDERY